MLFVPLLLLAATAAAQTPYDKGPLTDDGNEHSIDCYEVKNVAHNWMYGQPQDFTIPYTAYSSITFILRGGEGGDAKSVGSASNCKGQGGEGATVSVTVPIGDGPGELPPGSVVRFIVGRAGYTGIFDNYDPAAGGGGGGTAVLARIPGRINTDPNLTDDFSDEDKQWIILAVAGGGGGGMADKSNNMHGSLNCKKRHGQDGVFPLLGRLDGTGGHLAGRWWMTNHGNKYRFAGGGGGAYATGGGDGRSTRYGNSELDGGKAGYPAGGEGGSTHPRGGYGFGAGGSGEDQAIETDSENTYGGGGGGYQGGNAGPPNINESYQTGGDGGYSYVNPRYAHNVSSIIDEQPGNQHGHVKYQFNNDQIYIPPPDAFITTWTVTEPDTEITIPTHSHYTYNYDLVLNKGYGNEVFKITGQTGSFEYDHQRTETFQVEITGDYPRFYLNEAEDAPKLVSIDQWGTRKWESMHSAFFGAKNMDVYNATDIPDLSQVTDMVGMFSKAHDFNGDISNWDVSTVKDMSWMFNKAHDFNGDISNWDVSTVKDMSWMFHEAERFNQDISNWNVSTVTNMDKMFLNATSFNQNLSDWDISNVSTMFNIFNETSLTRTNWSLTLEGWAALADELANDGDPDTNFPRDINMGTVPPRHYSSVDWAYAKLTDPVANGGYNWTINDRGSFSGYYRLEYKVDGSGTIQGENIQYVAGGRSGSQVIALPGPGYAFSQWSDGVLNSTRTDVLNRDITLTARFVIEPDAGPAISTLSPASGATHVPVGTDLAVTFDMEVQKGAGNIGIYLYDTKSRVEQIDVSSDRVEVDGATVTINPVYNFSLETNYYVEIDAGAFKDISGKTFEGIANNRTTWNFTTFPLVTSISFDMQHDWGSSGTGVTTTVPSGEPVNHEGLQLPGQVGEWNSLKVGDGSGTTTYYTKHQVTSDGLTFIYNTGNDAYKTLYSGSDILRHSYVFLTSDGSTADETSWSITGLDPAKIYDLALFGYGYLAGINPADFAIKGHNAGNGTDVAATPDADSDGNFAWVSPNAAGEIHGTFSLRNGETTASWSGLQIAEATQGITHISLTPGNNSNSYYMDVTFSEGVYNTAGGTGALEASDFALNISGGTATLSDPTLIEVTNTNGSPLSGGETTVRIHFSSIVGIPDGNEALSVAPSSNSIYNAGGSAFPADHKKFVNLNDKTPPAISSLYTGYYSNYVDVVFSEGVYTTVTSAGAGSGGLTADDFTLDLFNGTVTLSGITTVTAPDGGALSGGETVVRVYFLTEGTAYGGDILSVAPSSNSAIYDASGHAASIEGSKQVSMRSLYNKKYLTDNGTEHTIDPIYYSEWKVREGSPQDFAVPQTAYNSITFTLRGGDGGNSTSWNCNAYGGEGATIALTVPIGDGPGELPPGSIVRFVVGRGGNSHSRTGRKKPSSGGGGGGTAILASIPGRPNTDPNLTDEIRDVDKEWIILAVAGGGGGAASDKASTGTNCNQWDGLDAQLPNAQNGEGGLSGDWSPTGGGGGAYADGEHSGTLDDSEKGYTGDLDGGEKGYPAGGLGGGWGTFGGYGFGAGGSGENKNYAGGGGGGYQGGDGGEYNSSPDYFYAEGGWSYVNPDYAQNVDRKIEGSSTSREEGYVKYSFHNDCQEIPLMADAFVTTWKVDSRNPGEFTIGTNSAYTYKYNVYWQKQCDPYVKGWYTDQTGNTTINISAEGTYVVQITGDFPHFYLSNAEGPSTPTNVEQDRPMLSIEQYLNNAENALKLASIEQWGTIKWESMASAFFGAGNMVYNATDKPDLSNVKDMILMFGGATNFNGDLSGWDVSGIENMGYMFYKAGNFDQDISGWNVSNAIYMDQMFAHATGFNRDISKWNVSGVTHMNSMFAHAQSFNSDISGWNVSGVKDMESMFHGATGFDQNLADWDISGVTNMYNMLYYATGFSAENWSNTLVGWAALSDKLTNDGDDSTNFPTGINMSNVSPDFFTCAQAAYDELTETVADGGYGWTIGSSSIDGSNNTATDFLSFSLPGQTGEAKIDRALHTIDIEVPYGTELSGIVPTFTLSCRATATVGGNTQTSGVSQVNFTNGSVTYKITAGDGTNTQDWTVTLTNTAGEFIEFSFPEKTGDATITPEENKIEIEVAYGTDLTRLIATFTLSRGAKAYTGRIISYVPIITLQESGVTENDFSKTRYEGGANLLYVVVAEDGSRHNWQVFVTVVPPNTAGEITSFSFEEKTWDATITPEENKIEIEVAYGTDLTRLIATFTLSEGAKAYASSNGNPYNITLQKSGLTENDFSKTQFKGGANQLYIVLAEDGSQHDWQVFVTVAAEDNTSPTIVNSGLSPANGATGVGIAPDLVITFSEPVRQSIGYIYLYRSSDDNLVQGFSASMTNRVKVSESGKVATINLPQKLAYNTDYYVKIERGAFQDKSGNLFAGITDNTTWNFTTATFVSISFDMEQDWNGSSGGKTSPIPSGEPNNHEGLQLPGQTGDWNTLKPGNGDGKSTHNATSPITTGGLTFTYNTGGDKYGSWAIGDGATDALRDSYVFLGSDGSTAQQLSWSITGLDKTKAYDLVLFGQRDPWNPGSGKHLPDFAITGHDTGNGTGMAVTPDGEGDGNFRSVLPDANGDIHGTFSLRSGETHASWSGLQIAISALPAITDISLASDNSYIDVTFDEGVYSTDAGSGGLETGDFALTISGGTATSPSITSVKHVNEGNPAGGETTVRVYFTMSNTPADGNEVLLVAPSSNSAIYDADGNAVSTAQSKVSLNDKKSPAISTSTPLSPADGATGVPIVANLEITFSEEVERGSGYVTLYKWDGTNGTKVEQISVSNTTRVTISGAKVTINPPGNLVYNTDYYVKIDGGAFQDKSGNLFAGITDNTTWNFTTTTLMSISFDMEQGWNGSSGGKTSTVPSGEPSNHKGLQLPGQTGDWNTLKPGNGDGKSTHNATSPITAGGLTFTYNTGGDKYGSWAIGDGATDALRDSYVFLGSEGSTAQQLSWSITGLDKTKTYDLVLFGQKDPWNPGSGKHLPDFAITGHDAGNGTGMAVTPDGEGDGNFRSVLPDANGDIHGTFSLRSGETHASWSGLQIAISTLPAITGISMASDNSYVDVTFGEGVYSTDAGSGGLETGDFALTISGGTVTSPSITSVKNVNEGNPAGGETTVRVYFTMSNTPADGNEVLSVAPSSNSAIYDADGNAVSTAQGKTVNLKDKKSPTISSLTLASDNSYVDVTFSEAVYGINTDIGALGTGDFTLTVDDNGTVTTPTITSVNPTNSVNTVRIIFTLSITPEGDETLSVTPGSDAAIYDANGNAASTSPSTTTLNDKKSPTISSLTLASDNSYVDVTFSEAVYGTNSDIGALGTGDFTLTVDDNGTVTTPTITSVNPTNSVNTVRIIFTLTITPDGDETLSVAPGSDDAIYDANGNAASSTSPSTTTLNDKKSPTISTSTPLSPADGATGVTIASDLEITFSEEVQQGSGYVTLYKWDGTNGAKVEQISVSNTTQVTISGAKVTISPSDNLAYNTTYYVNIDNGAIEDKSGNKFVGTITDDATWNFTTEAAPDTTPPVISSLSIADDNSYVEVTFSEAVFSTDAGTGVLDKSDFILNINDNGTVTSPAISSVTTPGGKNIVRIHFSMTGTADGSQTLSVAPASGSAIYDAGGNTISINQSTVTLYDKTPPTIGIDVISGDDRINALEAGEAVKISGTSPGAEDGQQVSVELNGKAYTGGVNNNEWSVSVPAAEVQGLSHGDHTVVAGVSDKAGNPAILVSRSFTLDVTAPVVMISSEADDPVDGPFTVIIRFSEAVRTITADDLNLENATVSDWSVSATVYSATLMPLNDGEVSISVAGGITTDHAGNPNTASDTLTKSTAINTNKAPAAIAISSLSIAENEPAGSVIGTLTVTDANPADTHTLQLVSGEGSGGNASFGISDNKLISKAVFDHETQSRYSIRIRATDPGNLSVDQVFTISITNLAEAVLRVEGALNFEPTFLGNESVLSYTIHNDGDLGLEVTSIAYPAGFQGGGFSRGRIEAREAQETRVIFTPTVAQTYSGIITITTNSAGTGTLSVSGDGVIITGTDDAAELLLKVEVYPNPASKLLYIRLSGVDQKAKLSLTDINGQVLMRTGTAGEGELKIHVSDYRQGVYILKIESGDRSITKKVLIID